MISALRVVDSPDAFTYHLSAPPVTARVAIVNMPFAMADRPSIQCGLLKSALKHADTRWTSST